MSVGYVDTSGVTEINGVPVVEQGSNSAMDQDMFLNLLVTQLANQDPMNPMDNDQMVAQQAQFAQLEATTNLTEKMDSFITSQTAMMQSLTASFSSTQTLSLLGSEVTYPSDVIQIQEGEVSGLYYSLTEAANVGFVIRDEAGTPVRTINPELTDKGENIPVDFNTQGLLDGEYTVDFNVTNLAGDALTGTGFGKDEVSSIDFATGIPGVKLANGVVIGTGDIISVTKGGE